MRKALKRKDKLTIKAKKEGFKARSVYKLFQLSKRYKLIRKRDIVLDLGSYPGSWLQAIIQLGGNAVGVDLRRIEGINHAKFILGDVFNKGTVEKIKKHGPFNAVISDLAPNTTGIKDMDSENSYLLAEQALSIANQVLRKDGKFLCKIFEGEGTATLIENIRKHFKFVKASKPEASKKRSKEIYIIATGFKQGM